MAANSGSIQFNYEALVGVNTNSTLFAAHQVVTSVFFVRVDIVAYYLEGLSEGLYKYPSQLVDIQ